MDNSIVSLIMATDLFKDFSPMEITKLLKSKTSFSKYKKNTMIYFEGEKCISLDILLKGEIIIQRIDEKGNVLTIVDFHSGDIIGGNLLFSNHPYYPMSIIAKTDVEILHLQKILILELCQESKIFLTKYLSSISDKTTMLTNKIKEVSLKSIRNSIIDYLKYQHNIQNSYKINLGISKKELAERLGIQRTSLSRELNKMRKDGLVEFDAHSITIINNRIIK
ncbi:Crp/Fnr family transcriptional regulator [Alkaliphilus serpentinus]|uniref:Crp/Fnr family transcriptional regulator n=1 Tax=Alkaliphilus serpentinus TaxID=1482731 RepID=A0A833MAH3_9FIRM|nr:Crp/Fnr family transcriptional regulator [Alkaliphilus serpentinus]KAB3532198.1 Crp/Fnr family transcriptional regulator [Alkaliphilus serpentinus]